jgi:hypothetical protein
MNKNSSVLMAVAVATILLAGTIVMASGIGNADAKVVIKKSKLSARGGPGGDGSSGSNVIDQSANAFGGNARASQSNTAVGGGNSDDQSTGGGDDGVRGNVNVPIGNDGIDCDDDCGQENEDNTAVGGDARATSRDNTANDNDQRTGEAEGGPGGDGNINIAGDDND